MSKIVKRKILKTKSVGKRKCKHYIFISEKNVIIYKLFLIKTIEFTLKDYPCFLPIKFFKDYVLIVQIMAFKKETLKYIEDIAYFPDFYINTIRL